MTIMTPMMMMAGAPTAERPCSTHRGCSLRRPAQCVKFRTEEQHDMKRVERLYGELMRQLPSLPSA